jgi:head-tail adaptor
MASVNAGEFRERIIFQRLSTATDGAGGTKEPTWTNVFTAFAKIEPMDGVRYSDQTQMLSGNGYKVTSYWPPVTITTKDRIVTQSGHILTIHSLKNNMLHNHIIEIIAQDGR